MLEIGEDVMYRLAHLYWSRRNVHSRERLAIVYSRWVDLARKYHIELYNSIKADVITSMNADYAFTAMRLMA